jgi:hypothetical protein
MKTLTQSAQAAKAIKQELKSVFPDINFSVKSSNFSMGDSVNISWTDGPSTDEVENITGKYQYGSFNGMEDIYENTNNRNDIPQSKYVSCSRHFEEIEKVREEFNRITNANSWDNNFYRIARKCSLPLGATNLRIERTDKTCGVIEELYFIAFDVPGTQKQTVKINGSFVVVDYSEKAVAVFGDTKAVKEELKTLGGRFNPFLTREGQKQAGWIFPKTKKTEVESLLNNSIPEHETKETVKTEINLCETLRKKAEATMQQAEKIDGSVKGNWTHRRQSMADSMQHKKDNLFKIANVLNSLADAWENNTIDSDLKRITSRAAVELILHGYFPTPPDSGCGDWYKKEYPDKKKKVNDLGIFSKDQFTAVKNKLQNIGTIELTEEQKREKEKAECIKKIHAANIPGFFPTPEELINKMIDLSGITHVSRILEPSAGIGSIADKIAGLCDSLDCCEINYTLHEFLTLHGFNVVGRDILEYTSGGYDAIFMNPPFENREDLKHIMHCYELLNDSGVLVSIISAGTLKTWFSDWLNDKTFEIYEVGQGAFKGSFNSTGVACKIIVINK